MLKPVGWYWSSNKTRLRKCLFQQFYFFAKHICKPTCWRLKFTGEFKTFTYTVCINLNVWWPLLSLSLILLPLNRSCVFQYIFNQWYIKDFDLTTQEKSWANVPVVDWNRIMKFIEENFDVCFFCLVWYILLQVSVWMTLKWTLWEAQMRLPMRGPPL